MNRHLPNTKRPLVENLRFNLWCLFWTSPHEVTYDCHPADMRTPLRQVEDQQYRVVKLVRGRFRLSRDDHWVLWKNSCHVTIAVPSNKMHDNSIVLYKYFEKCFPVMAGLSVGSSNLQRGVQWTWLNLKLLFRKLNLENTSPSSTDKN